MKKITLTILSLILFSTFIHAQKVLKFSSDYYAYKTKYSNGWNDWSKWIDGKHLVTVTEEYIITKGVHDDKFEVYSSESLGEDSSGYDVFRYWVLDKSDGKVCEMKLRISAEDIQLYTYWNSRAIVYKLKLINE